ncbi:class I SAM-dependent methyltransferase [Parvibaculum sp.]|jgi:ubiquinone/menaquinone biosynthesis C-methylase UbiE|uniref:class I SAM-dependent methyltransferase n=1 Tax=Parvibaculum sp. TaxID=2024848 RepID=UPI002FDA542C
MSETDHGASAAAEKWNKAHVVPNFRRRFVNHIPWVRNYIHFLYLNNETPFSILKRELGSTPVDDALELAGGRGDFSLALLTSGLARNVRMVDLSESAAKIAREKADSQGISGFVVETGDVNDLRIGEKYDLVTFSQSLHHIFALEHILGEVRRALKPGGLFYVSDYIGPTRMQWTDAQLKYMNDLLALMPEELRAQINPDGSDAPSPKTSVKRISLETFERVDPSEAVRSADIDRAIRETFDVVDFYPMGGTISYELYRTIAHNFDVADRSVQALLKTVLYFEHDLISRGVLNSDFGLYLCRAR